MDCSDGLLPRPWGLAGSVPARLWQTACGALLTSSSAGFPKPNCSTKTPEQESRMHGISSFSLLWAVTL